MLFQKTILKKYLGLIDEEIVIVAWKQFQAYFLDAQIQANIQQSKEEQFQEGFLRTHTVPVLAFHRAMFSKTGEKEDLIITIKVARQFECATYYIK